MNQEMIEALLNWLMWISLDALLLIAAVCAYVGLRRLSRALYARLSPAAIGVFAVAVILHHTPKSGANEKLCFAGAGASSLQRYVQTIARISQDKAGAYWFHAVCREFDDPIKPVLLRR